MPKRNGNAETRNPNHEREKSRGVRRQGRGLCGGLPVVEAKSFHPKRRSRPPQVSRFGPRILGFFFDIRAPAFGFPPSAFPLKIDSEERILSCQDSAFIVSRGKRHGNPGGAFDTQLRAVRGQKRANPIDFSTSPATLAPLPGVDWQIAVRVFYVVAKKTSFLEHHSPRGQTAIRCRR